MRYTLLALTGCVLKGEGADTGSSPAECPALDCRDALTLTVLGVDGLPSTWFSGRLTPPDASPITFICGAEASSFEGGVCLGEGRVELWTHAESYSGWVDEGDDAPWWSGDLVPAWEAPYDSEECGHYCWQAVESITLSPCKGCG